MSHNGGILQINPGFLQTGRDYPFINFLKTGQTWQNNTGAPAPDTLDDNGYPNAPAGSATWTTDGGVYTVVYIPSQTSRPGNYVIRWTGEGTLATIGTKQSGNWTDVNGRVVTTIADDNNTEQPGSIRIVIKISGRGATDYIRDLAFMHEDDEQAWLAGEMFQADFKNKILEGGFGVIRFMAWVTTNISNISLLSQHVPETHYSYTAQWAKSSIYAGVTSNVGDAYTVAAPSGWSGLVDKATVIVKFNATSTATAPTLDVSGSGAKTILNGRGSSSLTSGSNTLISITGYATLVYDSLLDGWLKLGSDLADGHILGYRGGCPLSVMIRLCNEVGAHPWLNVPHFALDPFTSYTTDMATYVRDNLDGGLVPRFEPSNEIWNTFNGFFQTNYAKAREVARGYAANGYHYWYGRALSQMGQAISDVYGGDRSRYQVICGVQTGDGTTAQNERLLSSRYVTESGDSTNAAKNWATHVAVTGYWHGVLDSTTEQALADEYATANETRKAEILAESALSDDFATGFNLFGKYAAFKAWAEGLGVNGLTEYEGGYGWDMTNSANLDNLRVDTKGSPEMVWQTLRRYQGFIDAGGEFPSCLVFAGPGYTRGKASSSWSILDPDIYVTPDPPQWTAFKMWNAGQRRFKVT